MLYAVAMAPRVTLYRPVPFVRSATTVTPQDTEDAGSDSVQELNHDDIDRIVAESIQASADRECGKPRKPVCVPTGRRTFRPVRPPES
jgi:hypothetical protein